MDRVNYFAFEEDEMNTTTEKTTLNALTQRPEKERQKPQHPRKARFGFLWVTLALFLFSLVGHWAAGWVEYKQQQEEHHAPIQTKDYVAQMTRGTLENWQSEFLQLVWQVAGLSFLWYVGSPQSKEGDERKEEKLDAILKMLDPVKAESLFRELEAKYPKGSK
jgi:hypothetical protein